MARNQSGRSRILTAESEPAGGANHIARDCAALNFYEIDRGLRDLLPFYPAEAGPQRGPEMRYTERWRVPIDIDVISPAAVAARRVPVV
jgi:hypothetical protein